MRALALTLGALLLLPASGWSQDSLSLRSPAFLLSRAREFRDAKQFSSSIALYGEYLGTRPEEDDVRTEMARTLSWNGQLDSALAQYDLVLSREPNFFDARFGRCQVLGWKGDYGTAIREADQLQQLYPRNNDLLLLAASLHLGHQEPEQSLVLYDRVIAAERGNVDALLGRCRALEALGKTDEAYADIVKVRDRFPQNAEVQQLYAALQPKPNNQIFVRYQNESFDVQNRSDHRTFQAQYYRTLAKRLTVYAEADVLRRFDQDDQAFGAGAYFAMGAQQSMSGYCLVSPNAKATSSVDASLEYERSIVPSLSLFCAYRLINFKTETAHVLAPGFSWTMPGGLELKPRVFVSRTVEAKTTSIALAIQCSYPGWGAFSPFASYAVGNEAYRGITLDNIESSASWGLTVGGRYALGNSIFVRGSYQYLNRIGVFRENIFDIGLGYYW